MCFGYEKFTFLNHFLIFFTKCDSDNPGHNIIGTFEFSGFLRKNVESVTLVFPLLPQINAGNVAEYLGDLQVRKRLLLT